MITQLGFVRISSHPAMPQHVTTQEALHKLREIIALPTHSYWAEPAEGFANRVFESTSPELLTHGLVTDGYLATLARSHDGKLATFDKQCARTFGEKIELISSS